MKERSVEFARDAGPHIQRLKTKSIHLYHESKKFMEPHIVNAQEVIQPYVKVYLFLPSMFNDCGQHGLFISAY